MSQTSLDFQFLKRAVSIEHVLLATGLIGSFRIRGDSLVGPCPLHQGNNPNAFVISRSKNLWHCFTACHTGGDLIDFVRRLDACSYRQTAVYLARLAGAYSPPPHPAAKSNMASPFQPFSKVLPLHYSPFLRQKGISPLTAQTFETGEYRLPGWLSGCIAVRLFAPDGLPLGYAGRVLDPIRAHSHGKWKFPKALPAAQLLFNYHRLTHWLPQACFIVECPWAVMRLAQLQIPAVALMGTHLAPPQRQLLWHTPRLILMLDGDIPGVQAAHRLKCSLEPHHLVHIVELPENTDPDDLDDQALTQFRPLLFS